MFRPKLEGIVLTVITHLGHPDLILVVALERRIVPSGGVEHIMISAIIDALEGMVDGGSISVAGECGSGRKGGSGADEGGEDGGGKLHRLMGRRRSDVRRGADE